MIQIVSPFSIRITNITSLFNYNFCNFRYFYLATIFPNPFNEKLFITSNSKITYEVILTDLTGKVLMKKEMTENNMIDNLSVNSRNLTWKRLTPTLITGCFIAMTMHFSLKWWGKSHLHLISKFMLFRIKNIAEKLLNRIPMLQEENKRMLLEKS